MAADSTCQPWVCSDAYALDESKSPSNSAISGLGNYTFLPGKSSMKRTNVYASSLSARLRGFLNALENLPLRPRPPRQNATHCKRSIAEALLEFGRQLCNAVSDAYHSRRSSSAEYRQAADGGRLDCSGQTSNQSVCWARSGRSGISAKIRLWRSLFAASICLDIRSNERSQQPRPNRFPGGKRRRDMEGHRCSTRGIAGRLVRGCEVRRGSAGVLQLSPPQLL